MSTYIFIQVIRNLAALQTAISKNQQTDASSDEHVHPVEGNPTEKTGWIIDDLPFQLTVIEKTTSVGPIAGIK